MSYSKQTWINNESVANESRMNHIEDGIYQNSVEINNLKNRNIISVGITSNITLGSTGENTITLDRIRNQIGTGFTISNGKVYVGDGITKVLACGSVYTNRSANAATACNVYIKKNGVAALNSINSVPSGQRNETKSIEPQLIDVESGDYFELGLYGYSGDVISSAAGTCMTIEAVG